MGPSWSQGRSWPAGVQTGFSGCWVVVFLGLGVCSWWMETRLVANTGFLEGRAVVCPLVDGSRWVLALC